MTDVLKELVALSDELDEREAEHDLKDTWSSEQSRNGARQDFNEAARNAIPALKSLLSQEAELRELLAAERARREKAEEVVDALADALTWASGSDDFNEGGKAREGWLKLGRPAIDAWLEYRTQYPRVEEEQ